MSIKDCKVGDTVYLTKFVVDYTREDEFRWETLSEHVISSVLLTRVYVEGVDRPFVYPSGGDPKTRSVEKEFLDTRNHYWDML